MRTLSLPPFAGATRRIVLAYIAAFFGLLLLTFALPHKPVAGVLVLVPAAVAHGHVWELLTYTFVPGPILNTVFALLAIWFFGAVVESQRGGRWLLELFYVSVIGGGLTTTAAAYSHLPGIRSDLAANGAWGASFAMLVAFATLNSEEEILFFFLRIKASYLVAIYVLIDIAFIVRGEDALSATMHLACGLSAYLFVRFAPRRGLAFVAGERYFGARNNFYRWKRRRAARKFEVYMRKQDRVVHFDENGRYIAPEEVKKDDSERKKWVN